MPRTKRVFDIVAAGTLLVVGPPRCLIVGLAIRDDA
jgi:lipopolysaccharide/colanic/teichoic acid biosynthesis glycosyltransferase